MGDYRFGWGRREHDWREGRDHDERRGYRRHDRDDDDDDHGRRYHRCDD